MNSPRRCTAGQPRVHHGVHIPLSEMSEQLLHFDGAVVEPGHDKHVRRLVCLDFHSDLRPFLEPVVMVILDSRTKAVLSLNRARVSPLHQHFRCDRATRSLSTWARPTCGSATDRTVAKKAPEPVSAPVPKRNIGGADSRYSAVHKR